MVSSSYKFPSFEGIVTLQVRSNPLLPHSLQKNTSKQWKQTSNLFRLPFLHPNRLLVFRWLVAFLRMYSKIMVNFANLSQGLKKCQELTSLYWKMTFYPLRFVIHMINIPLWPLMYHNKLWQNISFSNYIPIQSNHKWWLLSRLVRWQGKLGGKKITVAEGYSFISENRR